MSDKSPTELDLSFLTDLNQHRPLKAMSRCYWSFGSLFGRSVYEVDENDSEENLLYMRQLLVTSAKALTGDLPSWPALSSSHYFPSAKSWLVTRWGWDL